MTGSPVRRLDRFELAALAGLAILSVAVLAGLILRVWIKGGIVTGSDGLLVVDQLQYLNWLRQAGDHVLVTNLYDLGPGPRTYLHPGVLISGLIHRLGLGLAASYYVWIPVAVAALFAGALLYTRRFIGLVGDRRLALAVGLFSASPVAALVGWAGIGGKLDRFRFDFLAGEMWSGNYLWGYLFTAIAVGLFPLGLLAYERGRAGQRPRMVGWAAACGLLIAWFQPWQGATYAVVLAVAELLAARRESRTRFGVARDLVPTLAATVAPLAYYLVLSHTDAAWRLAGRANDIPRWPWWVTVLGLAPLALPALAAYARPARDFGQIALRAWPVAALAIFYQPAGTFPFHAFQGLTLPLAVLAVLAVRDGLGDRALPLVPALVAATLLIVPGTAYFADRMRDALARGYQAHYLTIGEHDALAFLDRDPEPGGVLAPAYIGTTVPAYTGRETWVGAGSWTPDFPTRRAAAERLFAGTLRPAQARAVVIASGARFLLSDCHGRADVQRLVSAFTDPPHRFGCATVYRVRTGA